MKENLNEYERSKWTNLEITNWKCVYWNLSYFWYGNWYSEFLCISKRYEFIQRLVENNKIDIERLHKIVDYRLEIKENYVNAHDYNSDCLLMLLSISQNPISDLISYLK